MVNRPLKAPEPSRQVAFHQLLVAARKTWLLDALSAALADVDPSLVKKQLGRYVPRDVQKILAAAGIRDEHVFPTPVVLETAPTLVGYYRLLLGPSQKSFYTSGTGMGRLKTMETKGTLSAAQKLVLGDFCKAMSGRLADLVRQLSPSVTKRDIAELPLLTLGSQFQGAKNVDIGKQATVDVFLSLAK
jgi:hypothetical protein